jgi:hypothetical protein
VRGFVSRLHKCARARAADARAAFRFSASRAAMLAIVTFVLQELATAAPVLQMTRDWFVR